MFRDTVYVSPDPWGLDSLKLFFGAGSNSLIISENTDSSSSCARLISVAQRVPMITYDDSMRSELVAQIDNLGVTRILLVGENLPFAATSGALEILHDPGTTKALGEMTAFQFTNQVVAEPEHMAQAVANLDPSAYTQLKAAWEPLYRQEEWKPMLFRHSRAEIQACHQSLLEPRSLQWLPLLMPTLGVETSGLCPAVTRGIPSSRWLWSLAWKMGRCT